MDLSKGESLDDFWLQSDQESFDFNDERSPQLPKISVANRQNEGLNILNLLQCTGLNEVAENKKITTPDDLLTSNIDYVEEDKSDSFKKKDFSRAFNKKSSHLAKTPTISQTIKNIVIGSEFSLEIYKSRKEKKELLKASVNCHDGNAIITVILFLRNTLKKNLFQREILLYPEAINMYLSYLEAEHEIDELIDTLLLLNRLEEAAMVSYELAVSIEHPESKIKWISNCLRTHFQSGSNNDFLKKFVVDHHNLLLMQLTLKELYGEKFASENDLIKYFQYLTGKNSIIDVSVMNTVIFNLMCVNLPENHDFSLTNLKKTYNISNKQYTWVAIRTLAVLKRWEDIEGLFESKNWFGGKKLKSCIGFYRVVKILSKENAPIEILTKYIRCIENEDVKLLNAITYKCHSLVIELYKNAKDRQGLLAYQSLVPPHSVEFCTIKDVLNNSMIKWRN